MKIKKKRTDEITRSFQSKSPDFIIPIYNLLQTVLNCILANPNYAKQFISIKLTKIDDKGHEVAKQRGELWREVQAITGNPLKGLINNAAWYMRILEANILSLVKSHQQQVEIYKLLKQHNFVIDEDLRNNLSNEGYYPSVTELRNLAKANQIPDMPKHSVLKLNYAFADKQLFTMNDNLLCSLQIISKDQAKKQGISDRTEFQIYLPSYLRNTNVIKICKPTFVYNKKINQVMCQVPYQFKPIKHKHMTNILGVDLGRVKFYSATVLYQNNTYSDEYVPSHRLDQLNNKLARLNNSIDALYTKMQRAKANYNVNLQLQETRYVEYTNSREKRTRLREQIEWLMADELVDIAIKQHCKEIHLENLTWVNNRGGKWDFSMVVQHIKYVAEMHSITVKLVNCKNTSKRHPVTKQLGKESKRNIIFDDITVDRDQLASLNIALEKSGQEITDLHKRKPVRTHYKSRRRQNYNSKKQVLSFKGNSQIVVFLHEKAKCIFTFMQLNKNACDLDSNLADRKDMSFIRPYDLV